MATEQWLPRGSVPRHTSPSRASGLTPGRAGATASLISAPGRDGKPSSATRSLSRSSVADGSALRPRGRCTRRQICKLPKLRNEFIDDRPWNTAVAIQFHSQRELYLAAVTCGVRFAEPRITRLWRSHKSTATFACNSPPGAATGSRSHLRFRFSDGTAPVHKDRDLRLAETILLLEHRGDRRDRISLTGHRRQARNRARQSWAKKSASKVNVVARQATDAPAPSGADQ